MLFHRLALDAGAETFSIDFHDRLTVVAGVGRLEREGLINELVGALGDSRSGVHLEMASDAGNRFAIFRPEGARHRVVDIDSASDVSAGFLSPDGSIDLLDRAGLDTRSARRQMCITPDELHTTSETDRFLRALAEVDQGRLWEVAEKVTDREHHLDDEAEATGSAPEDATIVARIEELHRHAEHAAEQHETVRSWSLWGSFASIMSAVPVMVAMGAVAAVPFILGAVVAGLISVSYYRRLETAREAEADALQLVGANSYLSFHLQRVNTLLSSDQSRKRLMSAAEEHRAAMAQWRLIAGDIPVQWAVDHRSEIKAASAANHHAREMGRVARSTPEVTTGVVQDVSAALLGRFAELRSMGPGGEAFPVILEEPFAELPPTAKPDLLTLVAKAAAQQQIIYLTDDEEVASWARLESMTGEVSVIEPSGEEAAAVHPRNGRHVAA